MLLSGLSGRVWEGKQSLLKAARSVTITCKEKFTEEIKDESISIDKVRERCNSPLPCIVKVELMSPAHGRIVLTVHVLYSVHIYIPFHLLYLMRRHYLVMMHGVCTYL